MLTISRERGLMRPGAHRMLNLLAPAGGCSLVERPAILVTGTNGKGSVCALIESALRGCGFRTGLYTSPHLVHPRERIRVAGVPVSDGMLSALLAEAKVWSAEGLPDASSFELATAAALVHFAREKTDVDVFEIGLGGRLDSTNVLTPQVSVLTSVGLDHTEILGASEEDIAFDKAHISRRNRPLVTGVLSGIAENGLARALQVTGARRVISGTTLKPDLSNIESHCRRHGSAFLRASLSNLRVALAALQEWESETGHRLSRLAMGDALLAATWPGRFDLRVVEGRKVLFDCCHNLAGVSFFMRMLADSELAGEKFHLVYASLSDKSWKTILPQLLPLARTLVLTQVESERAVPAEDLASAVPQTYLPVVVEPELTGALERALSLSPGPILVVGSIALVGECMELWGIDPFAPH